MAKQLKHKLLIKVIYRRKKWGFFIGRFLIQKKVFKYGFRIKNIGNSPFPGGTIKNIKMRSFEMMDLMSDCPKIFNVENLNPRQEQIIWVEKHSTCFKGSIWIECFLMAKDGKKIITYQYDKANNEEEKYIIENMWGYPIYLSSISEYRQRITNRLILLLTALIFLDGIWGIKEFFRFILGLIKDFFIFLISIINKFL